jgi:hypothetical protein
MYINGLKEPRGQVPWLFLRLGQGPVLWLKVEQVPGEGLFRTNKLFYFSEFCIENAYF